MLHRLNLIRLKEQENSSLDSSLVFIFFGNNRKIYRNFSPFGEDKQRGRRPPRLAFVYRAPPSPPLIRLIAARSGKESLYSL